MTHRDLHPDNILLDDDGTVTAILDMDGAEPWDATVDFVKLTADTFPRYPGASDAFYAGYTHPSRQHFPTPSTNGSDSPECSKYPTSSPTACKVQSPAVDCRRGSMKPSTPPD